MAMNLPWAVGLLDRRMGRLMKVYRRHPTIGNSASNRWAVALLVVGNQRMTRAWLGQLKNLSPQYDTKCIPAN